MTPKLILRLPDGSHAEYILNEASFSIGRSSGNDIVLPAGAASGHHAVFKLNETGDFTITDLESTNKTMVNGRAVQTTPLRNGDSLLFGDIAAEYHSGTGGKTPYHEDHPTQIYEQRHDFAAPSASPPTGAAAQSIPAGSGPGVAVPRVIQRSVSTTARRRSKSADGGCFSIIVLACVLPVAFFAGLVLRHHQDKGEWFWNYLQRYLHG